MRLPTRLLRKNPRVHKQDFGHALILAGSGRMLGAAALTALSALRAGAGMVTLGVPASLNLTAQKKINNATMTWPLTQTIQRTFSLRAFKQILPGIGRFQSVAIGPGMSADAATRNFILTCVGKISLPMVIDADGLNAVAVNPRCLTANSGIKVLTPHLGEMARLTGLKKSEIEASRERTAADFASGFQCVVLLKGPATVVADPAGKIYVNDTGNPGMATAGSGDVLTGIIAAFLAQGLDGFLAAKTGAYIHGLAGDLAAEEKGRISLIASDIIDHLPQAFKAAEG
ncbi:MAG: NAD(P)H-hydrate dehydratase [Candidatus Omnitrophica bacterium]|nr:NAD(P)H-hydrate dehydratase [Candidatus Omnitrophota bacterium]